MIETNCGLYFADEIILEILSKLPIKSLFRSKCVCKRWYNLASNRSFIHFYNHLSATNVMLLLQHQHDDDSVILIDNKTGGVSELSFSFIKDDRVKIRASCNGLLCCSSVHHKGIYYVCNPITRDFRLLPWIRERPVTRFYPADAEPALVGLSFDLLTDAYKVVLAGYHRMFGHRPEPAKLVCSVFDSRVNKWRRFVSDDQGDHAFTHMNRNQVVFLNDSLHWMTRSFAYILVLDLNLDSWTRIVLPDEMGCSGNRVYLLEFDGKLSVVQISSVLMKIWVYEDGRWDVIDRVSLRCIRGMVSGIFPICQGRDYVFLAGYKQVLLYHRVTRTWKEMYSVKNNNSTMPLWFSAHSFRATIFPSR